jgi:catechol 2,3-dioxygenase-like lactoylglutathione lyase family enzyme
MSSSAVMLAVVLSGPAGHPVRAGERGALQPQPVRLETVALRVHRLDAMVAFYTEAFGAKFREVNTGGVRSQFGQVGDLTLKLVPIRGAVDFQGFQVHQLGFKVANVDAVVSAAVRHGGRMEGDLGRDAKMIHAAIRDPDGNTLELYQLR